MFLGIDISKAKFDAALLGPGGKMRHKVFANDPAGFRHLLSWLRSWGAQPVHACLEATGTYGEALAAFLSEQGHTVSLINPAGYPCLHG
jgi:transposase